MKEKNTLVAPWSHEVVWFQMLDFEISNSKSEVSKSNWWIYFFLENYVTSEGSVSHKFYTIKLQLPNAHYQKRFYANNYFE